MFGEPFGARRSHGHDVFGPVESVGDVQLLLERPQLVESCTLT